MKKLILMAAVVATVFAQAQIHTPQPSPAATVKQTVGLTDVEINYSRPGVKGRTVFGDLVPFGKLWRTGANANTTISFSDDIMIDGKTLKKGKYALYTNPRADGWDVFFYSDSDNWGTPEQWDDSKVALKATAKPENLSRMVETFTIGLGNLTNDSATLEISWEKTMASMKFDVPTSKTAMASIERALSGPTDTDYFASAQYFYNSNGDNDKALAYVNKALELSKDKPYYMYRQKSLIQARMGDKKGAIESAKLSLAGATAAKNNDYVKMNNDSIAQWSKK